MKEFRLELRWPPGDPIGSLLAEIPPRARSKLVRSLLEGALLPGGWARIANGHLSVQGAAPVVPATPPVSPTPSEKKTVDGGDGMSDDGRKNVLANLMQYGALD